jgi:manganese/iron transport system substrate-binding protein
MNCQVRQPWRWQNEIASGIALGVLLLGGCITPITPPVAQSQAAETLLELTSVTLNGRKLRVVATTNLVGDVVAQIGGDHIELSTLLAPGTDPHAYQLAPADRQLLEDADVLLINGLGLEAGMLPVLDELDNSVPVVAVSIGIETIEFGGHEGEAAEHEEAEHEGEEHEHHHEGADSHTWQSVPNVIVWTENIALALSALDPAHADAYTAAATDYHAELEALNSELHSLVDTLPVEQRKVVTDHDSLGYLAHEYGFTVVGTVIPSLSTVASASAQELAALEEQIANEGVKAIFVGTTVNPQVAEQLAADRGIKVVPIYTDSLSDANGPAPTYVEFMRFNLQTIVDALR